MLPVFLMAVIIRWLRRGLTFIALLLSQPLSAQCPESSLVYEQLQSIEAESDLKRIIGRLHHLNKDVQSCTMIPDSTRAKVLHILGRTYWYTGDLTRGAYYTRQAIQLNKKKSTTAKRANLSNSYYNLGRILTDQATYATAIQAYDYAIQVARNFPDKFLQASKAYASKSYLNFVLGDYEQAAQNAEQGYLFAERATDKSQMVENLVQQAQAYCELNRAVAAEKLLVKALGISQNVGDQGAIAAIYAKLAGVYKVLTQHENVIRNYQKAYASYLKIKDRAGCAKTLTNWGYYYRSFRNDYIQAIIFYKKALTFADEVFVQVRILANIGDAYSQMGRYVQALSYYQQALNIAPIAFAKRDFTKNPKSQTIQLVANKEYLLTLMQDKADTWLGYAKATSNHQRLQYALDTYRVADQMIDYMRWEHTGQQSKLFWREKTRGLYERAIETCCRLKDAEQAFHFFEKSRAVMLADKLNELGARQQLGEDHAKKEKELRQAVSDEQNDLAQLTPDSAQYKSVYEALETKQQAFEGFVKQLEVSNPAYYSLKYDTTTTKLADLKSHLAARNASFVTYFVGDSALYLLSVTGDKATLHQQAIGDHTQTARKFMALLADPVAMNRTASVTEFQTLGRGLYQQLLAPLHLAEGAVIVSPDGSFIPFEVLSRSTREPDYLVKNYAFSYAYSARLLLKNRGNSSRMASLGERDFLGVAPVTFAATLKQVSLPGSDDALKPIANRFRASSLLTGPQATRRTFVGEAPDARVIHLFTHATADTTNSEPLLYFADSTLRLSDLGDGGLTNTRLAVLAACKTGVGANQRGEGVFSLARGFAALGVPSVLTTLWSVENKATYTITDLFYAYVDQGLPKDEALQRAKQDWLANASGTDQLPNAWAGLILIGDTEPLSHPVQWPWVAGGTLLLLGAGGAALWWRRRYGIKPVTSFLRPV